MHWFKGIALICTFTAALTGTVQAQRLPQIQDVEGQGSLRALSGGTEVHLWRAVGRLDTGASFCSATLIEANLVLTAAHCVFHPDTFQPFAASDLTFRAGLRNGQAEAIRGVRRIMVLDGYVPERGSDFDMIGRDLALLELDVPTSLTSIVPFSVARTPWREGRVTVVSYGRDRSEFPSIEVGCEILERQGSVRAMSCQVESGASGSPVFRVNNGRAEIVAVMSASGRADGEDVSLAVMVESHLDNLMQQYRGSASPAFVRSVGEGPTLIDLVTDERTSIGARFVRP